MTVSWSDEDESEEEVESEAANSITALTGICMSDVESRDEEITYDELAASYKELCIRSEEVCKTLKKQKKIIFELQAEKVDHLAKISELNDEVTQLNSNLEYLKKQVVMMHNSTDLLDEILYKQILGKPKGIGFNYEHLNKQKKYNPELKFMTSEETYDPTMSRQMPSHPKRHQGTRTKGKRQPWVCHYCGRKGHIKPFCFKLYGYPNRPLQSKPAPVEIKTKKEWKPKDDDVSLIAHTSFRASSREDWYFDVGCSRHMTGVEKFLVDLKSYSTSFVTFGDGAKGEIKGIRKLINSGLPKLENVLLVKRLTANLISISQLCDQGIKVNFTKSECLVTNDKGDVLMKGVRSKDNCYLWVPQEEAYLSTCLITKEDEVKLWHQKLGYLNLRSMKRAIYEEAIRGMPKLKIEEGNICGERQIGKQTKMSHQKLQHLATARVLKLLHMDLMRPMQVESLGGKRY
ncbi:gag-pol polyprotein, partial [Trifolium medium]|nr:gag-pol polyprotein [Trifolium medium]